MATIKPYEKVRVSIEAKDSFKIPNIVVLDYVSDLKTADRQ